MAASHFVCPYESCQKTFRASFNMKRHIKFVHLQIKNFQCEVCEKRFITKWKLKQHSYIHLGLKPYECLYPYCRKSFRQASQLAVHSKIHSRTRICYAKTEENPDLETQLALAAHLMMLIREDGFVPMLPPIDPSRINREVKLPGPSLLLYIIKLLEKFNQMSPHFLRI